MSRNNKSIANIEIPVPRQGRAKKKKDSLDRWETRITHSGSPLEDDSYSAFKPHGKASDALNYNQANRKLKNRRVANHALRSKGLRGFASRNDKLLSSSSSSFSSYSVSPGNSEPSSKEDLLAPTKKLISRRRSRQEMLDEYVPDLNFTREISKWTSTDTETMDDTEYLTLDSLKTQMKAKNDMLDIPFKKLARQIEQPKYSKLYEKNITKQSISRILPDRNIFEKPKMDEPSNASCIKPSSNAKAKPIPLPNNKRTTLLDPSISQDPDTENQVATNALINAPISKFSVSYTSPKDRNFGSTSSSLNYMFDNTISMMDELNMQPEEIIELINKLPKDFLSLTYSQRKNIIMDLLPDKNYKVVMSLIKKFSLSSGKSNSSLNDCMPRSRHGSVASQYLNSFSPSIFSEHSNNSIKLENKGLVILNHRLGKIIGFGAWGTIRECTSVLDETKRAFKIIKLKTNPRSRKNAIREVAIWNKLHHENILPLIEWELGSDDVMYCLTDKIEDGTLYDLVVSWDANKTNYLSRNERCELITALIIQAVSALQYMHGIQLVHGDVKLENLLLQKTNDATHYKVIVCDFGMSYPFGSNGKIPKLCHKENYSEINYMEKAQVNKVSKNKSTTSLNNSMNTIKMDRLSKDEMFNDSKMSEIKPASNLQKLLKNQSKPFPSSLSGSNFDTTPVPAIPTYYVKNSSPTMTPKSSLSTATMKSYINYDQSFSQQSMLESALETATPSSHIGSLPYASPELLEERPGAVAPPADIWALGVTLYTMLTGRFPFKHDSDRKLRSMIKTGLFDTDVLVKACGDNRSSSPERFKPLIDVVEGCLTKDIRYRWELSKMESTLKGLMKR